jgi:hypothetical protein
VDLAARLAVLSLLAILDVFILAIVAVVVLAIVAVVVLAIVAVVILAVFGTTGLLGITGLFGLTGRRAVPAFDARDCGGRDALLEPRDAEPAILLGVANGHGDASRQLS